MGVGCGFAIGATGAGAVACGALAGAAANMVTYAIETKVEHKGNVSLGGMLVQGAIGAVVGMTLSAGRRRFWARFHAPGQ
ncbi:hypothetical protein OOJ91_28065 [Micromonospora lupini]|uniref:hypothetical protein n=1 Tax=Micromonospora lupini TaxID=285679 RepID=UPI002259FA96|nr:hypothetical protein [Micromonospora lupini]MCX5069706.1 hypothetical protein [Micromonospora lupini]